MDQRAQQIDLLKEGRRYVVLHVGPRRRICLHFRGAQRDVAGDAIGAGIAAASGLSGLATSRPDGPFMLARSTTAIARREKAL
jgi:hypothetical protein